MWWTFKSTTGTFHYLHSGFLNYIVLETLNLPLNKNNSSWEYVFNSFHNQCFCNGAQQKQLNGFSYNGLKISQVTSSTSTFHIRNLIEHTGDGHDPWFARNLIWPNRSQMAAVVNRTDQSCWDQSNEYKETVKLPPWERRTIWLKGTGKLLPWEWSTAWLKGTGKPSPWERHTTWLKMVELRLFRQEAVYQHNLTEASLSKSTKKNCTLLVLIRNILTVLKLPLSNEVKHSL